MPLGDLLRLVFETLRTQRLRSVLTMLGIVIGIASVVLLSSIGEGARAGIAAEFTQFGTTLVAVNPGKQQTMGAGPALLGTTRPLTLEDAWALRRVRGVGAVAPQVMGIGELEAGDLSRNTYIYGTVFETQEVLNWRLRFGSFIPAGDPDQIPPVAVLGPKAARELFPAKNPLGARIRVGEARFTVVGVMAPKGQMLGFDLDDMVFIPIRRAMRLFNRDALAEIDIYVTSYAAIEGTVEEVRRVLKERHEGEEDFTITTQADMLKAIDEVMTVLTAGVIAIAGISVFVGAMGILTIMWVSVHERTAEIGLVKAIGASDRQVMLIFLAEAAALSLAGGLLGIAAGAGGGWLLERALGVRTETPPFVVPISLGVSLVVGLVAGVVPALRAARLDPVEALREE